MIRYVNGSNHSETDWRQSTQNRRRRMAPTIDADGRRLVPEREICSCISFFPFADRVELTIEKKKMQFINHSQTQVFCPFVCKTDLYTRLGLLHYFNPCFQRRRVEPQKLTTTTHGNCQLLDVYRDSTPSYRLSRYVDQSLPIPIWMNTIIIHGWRLHLSDGKILLSDSLIPDSEQLLENSWSHGKSQIIPQLFGIWIGKVGSIETIWGRNQWTWAET